MPDSPSRTCPKCATAIPASFPDGLCPKCMLEQAAPDAPVAAGTQLQTLADLDAADKTIPVAPPVSGSTPVRQMGVPSLETLRGLYPELEILGVLGAGGMGAVYKARQPRLNRLVALKIMVAAPGHETDFALRFEREAQVLARLSHPHIVILYDFGELGPERTGADPLFYFLMEYVDGTDLGLLIKSKELKPAQALAIVPQICEALQYAHDQGITHRDIKPANILIDKKGTVKIADFGLAKMVTGTEESLMTGLTQTGTAMGTPHYMAPEQWEHPELVDHRADIYALGVVFYEMLTGERPAGVFEPPSKKTKPPVDKKLDGVVMRAMDKNPDRRYQQAGQIGDDVTRISGGNKRKPATTGAAEPKRSPLKPLLALGVAAVLAVGGWMLWQGGAGSPPVTVPPETALPGPSASSSAPALPQVAWVPMYRQAVDLAPLFSKPQALYIDFQSHAALFQDPASGLKLADGWLTPTTTYVKLPLPSARNAGVRMRVQMSEPTFSASIWLRGVDHGAVYAASWRGINRYFSTASKAAEYLAEQKNFVAKKPGESFTLEFYAIGQDLIFRYDGEVIRVREPGADPAIGTLNHLMIRNPVTDIEFINFDGLSEAEALKLAGVGETQPSAFPAGQWTKVLTTQAEVDAIVGLKGKVTLKPDGWLDFSGPKEAPGVGLAAFSATNAGVRVKLRISDKAPTPVVATLTLRHTISPPPRTEGYRMQFGGGDSANPTLSLAHYDNPTGKSTVLTKMLLPDALQAGDEFSLEFYTIGNRLIGRCNSEVVLSAEDQRLTRGVLTLHTGHLLRDIEVINFDGLSEADALKLAGVNNAVPQASLSWGGSRYAFVNDKVPWPEARKRADAAGGRLAVFETEAEERAVREHYRSNLNKQRYWIGGHAEKSSKEIRWITGAPVGKVAWGIGHPDWRDDPESEQAQREGLLCAVGLGVNEVKDGTDRWMIIHPLNKTSLGFMIEWDEVAAKTPKAAAPTTITATKDAPFVNTLGMKFVPVPITGGPTNGQRVLFSIWETRVQDFEVFLEATGRTSPKPVDVE